MKTLEKYGPMVALTLIAVILIVANWFISYDHPASHYIQGFVLERQPDGITCGPTSTLMVLKRYGKHVSLDEIKAATKTEWFKHGEEHVGMTSPDYILQAMLHFGVDADLRIGELDELKHYVSSGRPPIVLLRSSSTTWHYVVVIGYDEEKIVIADPGDGAVRQMLTHHFLGAWRFETDMKGRNTISPCPTCNGTGYWISSKLGPMGICEVCGGSGKQPDYLSVLLYGIEVYPKTMIVPNEPVTNR